MHASRRKGGTAGGIVVALVVLVVLVLLLGFWRGWFNLSTVERPADDRRDVTLSVDQGKIEQDTHDLTQKAKALGERAEAAADVDTVTATITTVDAGAGTLTATDDEQQPLAFTIEDSTVVEVDNERGELAALRAGDRVVIVYREDKGQRYVQKVTRVEAE